MSTYGFIGAGNMASALVNAISSKVSGGDILISNRTAKKALDLAEKVGGLATTNEKIAETADFVILGVKPQMMAEVLGSVAGILALREKPFVLVSMAAGMTFARLSELAGANYPMIRIMPNTPCAIGEGVMLYDGNGVSAEVLDEFLGAFSGVGTLVSMPERLFDAASAVSGCGPAYAYMFIEALADGAVACGIPRKAAYELACGMLAGSAKLAAQSGKHPGELKDAVCSPGGSTIEAVRVLERGGFRGTVTDAVVAACEKSKKLV